MKLFLFGFAFAWIVAAVGCVIADRNIGNPWVVSFTVKLLIVPVTCAWATAEFVRLTYKPRILNPFSTGTINRFFRGFLGGVLGLLLLTASLVFREHWGFLNRSDPILCARSAALAALIITLLSRRVRPGTCPKCRYDLRGLTPASNGKCPECGQNILAHA